MLYLTEIIIIVIIINTILTVAVAVTMCPFNP